MKRKTIGILVCMLIITSGLVSFSGNAVGVSSNEKMKDKSVDDGKTYLADDCFRYEKTTTGLVPPLDCGEDVDLNLVSAPIVIGRVPIYMASWLCTDCCRYGYWILGFNRI